MPGFAKLVPLARNISNLGGAITLDLFSEDDILATRFDFPEAADITAGEMVTVFTVGTSVLAAGFLGAARVKADIETLKVTSSMSGDDGSQSFSHGFECFISGRDKSVTAFLQAAVNRPCLAIATFPNGARVLFGTKLKPIFLTADFDSGAEGSFKKGYKLVGKQKGSCAFDALNVATGVTYTLLP
jgi:hypothetical protein